MVICGIATHQWVCSADHPRRTCQTMKLYTGDLSPYSAKVRMQIYAMGIKDDIEFDFPRSLAAAFFQGKLKEFSPLGRIPILEVEEGIIPESEVIAEYLDDRYPDRALVTGTPWDRANVRVISRIADIYLMNNIFLALSQMDPKTRVEATRDLLVAQVQRGIVALEAHIGTGSFAVGDTLTRADCSLVPALFMCQGTLPRLDAENPIPKTEKVQAYWAKIQQNEHAARIIDEMARGLKARLDGTERKMIEEAVAAEKTGDA